MEIGAKASNLPTTFWQGKPRLTPIAYEKIRTLKILKMAFENQMIGVRKQRFSISKCKQTRICRKFVEGSLRYIFIFFMDGCFFTVSRKESIALLVYTLFLWVKKIRFFIRD